jgi:hypothetical protein
MWPYSQPCFTLTFITSADILIAQRVWHKAVGHSVCPISHSPALYTHHFHGRGIQLPAECPHFC